VVGIETLFIDFSAVHRSSQRTVGFFVVVTVAEAALTEIWAKFREGLFDFLPVKMAQPKFL
jgi:hypothetical protein